MAATSTRNPDAKKPEAATKPKPEAKVTTKAEQPTEVERTAGILARRRVRATSHIIERIDGKVHELGEDGGRWIVRVIDTGKVHRFASYSEMTKAGRAL